MSHIGEPLEPAQHANQPTVSGDGPRPEAPAGPWQFLGTKPVPRYSHPKDERAERNEEEQSMKILGIGSGLLSLTLLVGPVIAQAQQPPAPCHPNRSANLDMATVRNRGDIRNLPGPLQDRLVQLAGRPHSQLPTQAYAEAHFDQPPMKPKPSQLFQYYLLDTTGFEPNPFTTLIPGVNDTAMLTATGPQ